MAPSIPLQRAGRIVRSGGVVAYPTEGVYGLGCSPHDLDAVQRLLDIKRRDPAMGLILIAAEPLQLAEWVADGVRIEELSGTAQRPVTWLVPAADWVPYIIRGQNDGIAVRITRHPVAAMLSRVAQSAIVSTSANISGRPPARNSMILRRVFGHLVDCIVAGRCGPARGASEIRDWQSGSIVRPAKT